MDLETPSLPFQDETHTPSDFGIDSPVSTDDSEASAGGSTPSQEAEELNDFGVDSPDGSGASAGASPPPQEESEELSDFGVDGQSSADDSGTGAGASPSSQGDADKLSDFGIDIQPSLNDSGTSVEASPLSDFGVDNQPSADDSATTSGEHPISQGETEELNDFGTDSQVSPEGVSDSRVDWNISGLLYGDSWEDAQISLSLHSDRVGRLTDERSESETCYFSFTLPFTLNIQLGDGGSVHHPPLTLPKVPREIHPPLRI